MALGALIIQNRFRFPDREFVEQITENPYLQYFIGLSGYQDTPPFDASTLVLFRKRITADMLNEANKYLLAHKDDDQPGPPSSGKGTDESSMLLLKKACTPEEIIELGAEGVNQIWQEAKLRAVGMKSRKSGFILHQSMTQRGSIKTSLYG